MEVNKDAIHFFSLTFFSYFSYLSKEKFSIISKINTENIQNASWPYLTSPLLVR